MKSQAYHRSFLHRQWFKKGVLYMQEHDVGEGHFVWGFACIVKVKYFHLQTHHVSSSCL